MPKTPRWQQIEHERRSEGKSDIWADTFRKTRDPKQADAARDAARAERAINAKQGKRLTDLFGDLLGMMTGADRRRAQKEARAAAARRAARDAARQAEIDSELKARKRRLEMEEEAKRAARRTPLPQKAPQSASATKARRRQPILVEEPSNPVTQQDTSPMQALPAETPPAAALDDKYDRDARRSARWAAILTEAAAEPNVSIESVRELPLTPDPDDRPGTQRSAAWWYARLRFFGDKVSPKETLTAMMTSTDAQIRLAAICALDRLRNFEIDHEVLTRNLEPDKVTDLLFGEGTKPRRLARYVNALQEVERARAAAQEGGEYDQTALKVSRAMDELRTESFGHWLNPADRLRYLLSHEDADVRRWAESVNEVWGLEPMPRPVRSQRSPARSL